MDDSTVVTNAIHMVKESHAEAVKLKASRHEASQINTIVNGAGIPWNWVAAAQSLSDNMLALQDAGCFAIPSLIAETITRLLSIPTIGIGAIPHASGQPLIYSDMHGRCMDWSWKSP
ncbi:cell wall biogenesis and architecture protein [Coemansia sp. RSA 1721]|nr:cell wall biogenesis and architecture protein [Coemansia sp. RSA 1721]